MSIFIFLRSVFVFPSVLKQFLKSFVFHSTKNKQTIAAHYNTRLKYSQLAIVTFKHGVIKYITRPLSTNYRHTLQRSATQAWTK
uniref:Secreted protein n=1 Tax=Anguilla anguilla TaxID=7936 RepID=A0A0E9STD9_ANGAN